MNGDPEASGAPIEIDPLSAALLKALLDGTAEDASMSLTRLAKRIGLGASVVLRHLSVMGDASLGAYQGPGWVQVSQQDGRWRVALTAAGRRLARQLGEPGA